MSVGLLLIAFVHDLLTYDRFNENGKRIYRITSIAKFKAEQDGKYSSTSKLIRQKIADVQQVTIVRRDFVQDASVGDKVLPIRGMWAEPSLFRIFTFPMLEGNPDTALKDPYTVVLTESTARKIFGSSQAMGQIIRFDSIDYQVTGIMKDVPFFSHINFEALVSLSTAQQLHKNDMNFEKWSNMYGNSVYLLLAEHANVDDIQSKLNEIAMEENRAEERMEIQLELLPLHKIVVGEKLHSGSMSGSEGPHISGSLLWILGGLAFIVILSACFNYTNLSIARAMRRFKEVGLRKAIGAGSGQVWQQFMSEAILISLSALLFSFLFFLFLRPKFINLAPQMQQTVKLELTPSVVAAFLVFSVLVGGMAGLLPALFFSKISALQALKNGRSVKMFSYRALRRSLVIIQYTVTLIFITTTFLSYVQYKNMLAFDLGFNTENVLNISMQGNQPDVLLKELNEMPEVTALSKSMIITSVGNAWGGYIKYKDSRDSALVMTNHVDENYLPLHQYKLVAGENFIARPNTPEGVREIIVNQQFLKRFNISATDPGQAIGEEITFSNYKVRSQKMTIIGVIKDFHYGKLENIIEPVAFMSWTPQDQAIINAKIKNSDLASTMNKIESTWKKIDPVHPLKAEFYEDAIKEAYSEFSTMIQIIAFLSFLTISIASMGLLGMVVFTTETRLKEICICKVMGASSGNLIILLSRNFLICCPSPHWSQFL
ncbi:ABC transporter permease [Arundinibacter roseus]|uniref:ABC transporter permease n=1 Tax=Arundinibacter roseus TaxID=2070510 RepID=UPI0021D080A7|nr:ABC transporter permease [Arundinibacter roseus]